MNGRIRTSEDVAGARTPSRQLHERSPPHPEQGCDQISVPRRDPSRVREYLAGRTEALYCGLMNAAADQWARELGEWAVPAEILQQAPKVPFVFPPEMFAAPPPDSESQSLPTRLARGALADGRSVLDIGCGGGAAAFAVAPPATRLIGTDRQEDMTKLFARTAEDRGISCETYPGPWPEAVADCGRQPQGSCNYLLVHRAASRSADQRMGE